MARLPLRSGDPAYLGRYELLSRLGSGGMGTVYLARTPKGRPVAIKAVRADFTRDAELLGRFRSEVARARQVPPFCTAEVLDADLDHDTQRQQVPDDRGHGGSGQARTTDEIGLSEPTMITENGQEPAGVDIPHDARADRRRVGALSGLAVVRHAPIVARARRLPSRVLT